MRESAIQLTIRCGPFIAIRRTSMLRPRSQIPLPIRSVTTCPPYITCNLALLAHLPDVIPLTSPTYRALLRPRYSERIRTPLDYARAGGQSGSEGSVPGGVEGVEGGSGGLEAGHKGIEGGQKAGESSFCFLGSEGSGDAIGVGYSRNGLGGSGSFRLESWAKGREQR